MNRLKLTRRSSRPEVFCKKGALRNFTKFTGKHLCKSLFFNKVAGLRPVKFSCEFFKISKNTFLHRTSLVAASVGDNNFPVGTGRKLNDVLASSERLIYVQFTSYVYGVEICKSKYARFPKGSSRVN